MPKFFNAKQPNQIFASLLIFSINTPLLAARPEPSSDISEIRVWVREPGDHRDDALNDSKGVKSIPIKGLKTKEAKHRDFQYGKSMSYRGVSLKDVIAAAGLGSGSDMIILHMSNGMIIPMPYQDSEGTFDKINPLLATSVKTSGKWSTAFPPISKPDEPKNLLADQKDPRPLRFHGNKVVVTSGYLPWANKNGEAGFSPWRFATSLEGIEFANKAAYYKQYEVDASAEFVKGQFVYEQRCQFCHSVRTIGGRYGWDYVDPLPIYKQKEPTNLLFHVKYPKADALNRGLMMPTQKDITSDDSKALWTWMKGQAEMQQLKYKPQN